MYENDPLYKLRHALAGLALALLLSVPVAAVIARLAGDLVGDSYGLRAGLYSLLLAHVVVGAAVLFMRVARHETRPLSAGRLLLWLASLWLWPLLLAGKRARADANGARGDAGAAEAADTAEPADPAEPAQAAEAPERRDSARPPAPPRA